MRPVRRRFLAPALLLTCLVLSSCGGSGRSVAAVCKVWDAEGLALHDKFEQADGQARGKPSASAVIGALASILGAPNELSRLMRQMGAVAPTDIAPDFESVSDGFKKVSESESKALTNPFGALAGNLVNSLAIAGSFTRVNAFLAKNCGIPTHG
ncbi:MAG: hypothetical protein ACYDC2_10565 [Solirubrobacteraceae bacterium]